MDFQPGRRVGAFEILDMLGSGGMGDVYRARDTRLDREVALKVLPPSVSDDPTRLARFDREARLLAALNHPGIGAIYGLEEVSGTRLLVLELVPGATLAERIARGRLEIGEGVSIGRQIADAVAFAHANGIVHRDLKPANIKITPNGVVKVLDFGLAKALAESPGSGANDPTDIIRTHSGTILGTPGYMSPEQARGGQLDRRTDVWSLGCILFEMLTGRGPFQRRTVTDTLAAIVSEDPDWSALPASTPPALRRTVARCLRRDPDRRLHDMADVRIELDEAPAAADAAAPASAFVALPLVATFVLVASIVLDMTFMREFVPPLVALYQDVAMGFEAPLGIYITVSRYGGVVFGALALALLAVVVAGRRVPVIGRRAFLLTTIVVTCAWTIGGLYLVARHGVMQAMRFSVGAQRGIIGRDLVALELAAGHPAEAIALMDPRHALGTSERQPGFLFQLAEAYRQTGDIETARQLYRRAQERAASFDEIGEHLLFTQRRWQMETGLDLSSWGPRVSDVRRLPDLARAVAQQRLDQLGGSGISGPGR